MLDWKDAAPGNAPQRVFDTGNIQWWDSRAVVVGPQADPPSPFPDEQALFLIADVTRAKASWKKFELEAKPFSPDNAPSEGWFDFQLFVHNSCSLELGGGGTHGTNVGKENPYDGSALVSLLIQASGQTLAITTIDGEKKSKRLGLEIPAATPFHLRVLWTATPDTIVLTFQIDGVDAHTANGEPVSLNIPNTNSVASIDYFRLGVGGDALAEGMFIGKISSGTQ